MARDAIYRHVRILRALARRNQDLEQRAVQEIMTAAAYLGQHEFEHATTALRRAQEALGKRAANLNW